MSRSVWNILFVIFTLLLLCNVTLVECTENAAESGGIVAAKWDFHEFANHITIMLFLLIVILIKMLFHLIPKVADYVPESLILILLGIIFGSIVRYGINAGSFESSVWQLTPELFFTYLLPPIVLEASYCLYNRTFSEYLGVVLIFAVLGTILNFLIIGFGMYGMLKAGAMGDLHENFDLKGILLFSSLIVAVDPVAVLAIFQEIGVELSLYYIVFGESLLNDAITVVLYDIMYAFAGQDHVTGQQIGVGIASFITVSFGGLLIGVIIGIISCLITRLRSHLNAFTLILLAYFSYILADTVGWSGIISMIGCGLVQAAYAFHNLDAESVILVHKMLKLVAEVSESVIFLFLGVEVLRDNLEWHTGFALWALVFCLIARAVVVLGITAIVNAVRVDNTKISYPKQLVLIYGGLRGAVAFSLAVLITPDRFGFHGESSRRIVITTSLFIILFTVGFMGLTMKPLVKLLKIRTQSKERLSLFTVLINHVLDETLSSIEVIANVNGRNVVRDFFMHLDEKYFRQILQRDPITYDQKIVHVYEKISLKLHFAQMKPEKTDELLEDIPETLRKQYSIASSMNEPSNVERGRVTTLPSLPETSKRHSIISQIFIDSGEIRGEPSSVQLANAMRSTRRASIVPNSRRQTGYDSMFRDMLESRNRAIHGLNSRRQTLGVLEQANLAFQPEDEEEADGSHGIARRKLSLWVDDAKE